MSQLAIRHQWGVPPLACPRCLGDVECKYTTLTAFNAVNDMAVLPGSS